MEISKYRLYATEIAPTIIERQFPVMMLRPSKKALIMRGDATATLVNAILSDVGRTDSRASSADRPLSVARPVRGTCGLPQVAELS